MTPATFIQLTLLSAKPYGVETLWKDVQSRCPDLSDWGKSVLSQGLNSSIGSILIEPSYICKDHRNLFSNYYSKKFLVGSAYSTRLHFFNDPDIKLSDFMVSPERFQDRYLGYSVIRPIVDRCIGRTVVDPKLIDKSAEHVFSLSTRFKVHVAGGELSVSGFPYTSQDTDATVCAHSALWAVCRYLSERYPIYPETYPYDLIEMSTQTNGRTVPYHGMTYEDYSAILSAFGAHPEILRVTKSGHNKIDRNTFLDMCAYVESGFPVLASLNGHVIVLIGHTLDFKRSLNVDADGFADCVDYWKQFVVVDDNAFPYAIFGYPNDPDNYQHKFLGAPKTIENIFTAVCPLPEKAYLPARKAREKMIKYFKNPAILTLINSSKEPVVTRLLLTTSASLKKRKLEELRHQAEVPDQVTQLEIAVAMPHFVWLMQVAPKSLYEQGLATGELVLDSTAGQQEKGLLFLRAGNKFFIQTREGEVPTAPKEFGLYTHNLGEKDP